MNNVFKAFAAIGAMAITATTGQAQSLGNSRDAVQEMNDDASLHEDDTETGSEAAQSSRAGDRTGAAKSEADQGFSEDADAKSAANGGKPADERSDQIPQRSLRK
jgi:hypothetical protein